MHTPAKLILAILAIYCLASCTSQQVRSTGKAVVNLGLSAFDAWVADELKDL